MEVDTQVLPILPLERAVILPHMAVTLSMESSEAKEALAAARAEQGIVLVVPRINGKYARVGTIAKIEDTGRLPNGSEVVVIRGLTRGIIGAGVPGVGSALRVQVEAVSDENASPRAFELCCEYKAIVENLLEQGGASDAARFLRGMSDPGQIADTAGYSPILRPEQKVEVLETIDVEQRLDKVIAWGREALAESSLKDKIRTDVTSGLDKAQREHLLRMQMDAIRKELGEGDDDIVGEYRKKIEEAGMPDAVRAEAERELERLERSTPQNPEHGWIRTYLDWMVELPGSRRADDTFALAGARPILQAAPPGPGAAPPPSSRWSALRASARRRWASPWRGPWVASSPGCRSAASTTRRRSVGTVARTAVRCRAVLPGRSRRRAPTTPSSCSTRSTRSAPTGVATRPRPSWRCWTRRRTTRSGTTTSRSTSTCPTCCSSRPPTSGKPSPAHCWTGWRSSRSTATPRRRRSSSAATTCSDARPSA